MSWVSNITTSNGLFDISSLPIPGTLDGFLLPQYKFSKHKTFLQKEGEKNKINKLTKHDRKVQRRK